MQMNVIYSACQ